MIQFRLPYPPTMNEYWHHTRTGQTYISTKGRDYRKNVVMMLHAARVEKAFGPLRVTLDVHKPDRRRRDLDNLLKPLFDALQHGGAYEDDSQIEKFTVENRAPVERGAVVVTITQHVPEAALF